MDDGGFAEFVELRYADLLRIGYLLTSSAPQAEDLVQGALLATMRVWRTIDDPMAYVRRTMVNRHISVWRRYGARELLSTFAPDRTVPDVADGVADRQTLFGALRALPPRTRAAIVLRYWADLSEAQTASVLGCSVGTVKSRCSRGLAALRDALGVTTVEDSRC